MSHMQGKPPGAAPGPPLPTRGERKKWENTKSLPNSGKLCGQHHSLALPPCSPLPTNVLERRNASGEAAPSSRAMGIVRERFPPRASAGIGGNAGSAHLPGMILRKFKLGIISLPPGTQGERGTRGIPGPPASYSTPCSPAFPIWPFFCITSHSLSQEFSSSHIP